MTDSRIPLGPADMLTDAPLSIELDGKPYWLTQEADGTIVLLLAFCPHAGGEVLLADGDFYCPLHYWTFDGRSGECTNRGDERLMRRNVELVDGQLYASGADY
ncbi:Rieske (2Fe-2S) protein [Cohnella sp. GbtcB17]|uniref:Rieske (2Fe-2S) protein n=1 Tax=Cohnella sp. GbtcB17 TaxID=2824762 RepID=UPI001C310C35|nr:Rieske (2Fe-2S) protein [Cohnella sp. GbtcB17]